MRPIACAIHKETRRLSTLPDLIQTGIVGLIQACDKWDPQRGEYIGFPNFARNHIRWAILSSLRGMNFREVQAVRVGAADEWNYESFDRCDPAPLPDAVYELHEALEFLTARQRTMIRLRLDGLTQRAAGAEMGITQAAAWSLERRAISALRSRGTRAPAVVPREHPLPALRRAA